LSGLPAIGVLAKVLPFRPTDPPDVESFANFEKQIFIVRDPRDRFISKLLYGVYDSGFYDQDDRIRLFIELLRRKESDSTSVSVKELVKTFATLNDEQFSYVDWGASYQRRYIESPLEFHDEHPQMFLFAYEDMIDGKLEALESYLSVTLERGETRVASELARVTRTKGYGNWRDWFTKDDLDYFRPMMQPFLDRYYPGADWCSSPAASIRAKYSSDYFARVVNDKRALMKIRSFEHAGRTH
jgi:hypothetical protein